MMIALRFAVLAAFALTFQSVYGQGGDEATGSSIAIVDAMMKGFDANDDNEIDFEEFKAVAEKWNVPYAEELIQASFKSMDKDGNQKIDREELKQFIQQEPVLREIFKVIDTNKDGFVNIDELKQYFASAEVQITEEDLQNMFNAFDTNADKTISFEEFQERFIN